jgi:hypothetical protein
MSRWGRLGLTVSAEPSPLIGRLEPVLVSPTAVCGEDRREVLVPFEASWWQERRAVHESCRAIVRRTATVSSS